MTEQQGVPVETGIPILELTMEPVEKHCDGVSETQMVQGRNSRNRLTQNCTETRPLWIPVIWFTCSIAVPNIQTCPTQSYLHTAFKFHQ